MHTKKNFFNSFYHWLQWLIAMTISFGIILSIATMNDVEFDFRYRALIMLSAIIILILQSIFSIHNLSLGKLSLSLRVFSTWVVLLATLALIGFITKSGNLYSRELIISWILISIISDIVICLSFRLFIERHRPRYKLAIIYDANGFNLIPQFNNDIDFEDVQKFSFSNDSLEDELNEYTPEFIYLLSSHQTFSEYNSLIDRLTNTFSQVTWFPAVQKDIWVTKTPTAIQGLQAFNLNEAPIANNPSSHLLKRCIDFFGAVSIILLLSPLLCVISILIKLDSRGPIIFLQKRHGLHGKIFQIYKFRSMYLNPDSDSKQTEENDERITRVGRLIRRMSIDELPQLFNVVIGQMSLVGPRPHAVLHNNYYGNKIHNFMARHNIKPGMTGLAQINGCRGIADTVKKMEERLHYDMEYISKWSLYLDIKILVNTPWSLVRYNAN